MSQDPYYGEQPPGYYQPPPMNPVSGLAIASMVTGIIGDVMILMTCCFGPTFLLAGPLGIAAVVMGYMGLKECATQQKEGRAFAITGLACGWTAIALFAIGLLAIAIYFGFFVYMATQAKSR